MTRKIGFKDGRKLGCGGRTGAVHDAIHGVLLATRSEGVGR